VRRFVIFAYTPRFRLLAKESVTNGHFAFLLRPGRFILRCRDSDGNIGARRVKTRAHRTAHATVVIALS
jgi:hypothetical protein